MSREPATILVFVEIIPIVCGGRKECLPFSLALQKISSYLSVFLIIHLRHGCLCCECVDLLLTREENWEFFLKMHLEWRCEYLKEKWNPHENKDYK